MSLSAAFPYPLVIKRPEVGSIPLSAATGLYLLVAMNQSFWSKGTDYLAGNPATLVVMAIGLASLFVAALVALSLKYVMKPLLILLVLASAGGSWFMDRYGAVIDVEMIRNAAETTSSEAGHLITTGFLLHMAVFGVLPSAVIAWIRVLHRLFGAKVRGNLVVIVPCLVVGLLAALSQARTYSPVVREHHDWFATLNPFVPIAMAVGYIADRRSESNITVASLGKDAHVAGLPMRARKPRLTIIVAGETARADNFSLGGYARLTNPDLAARDIVYFDDTTSCGTATAVSLPCMFSIYTRQDYSHRKGLDTENLLDVLVHAGIKVEWWDNNTGSKGVADRVSERAFWKSGDPRLCIAEECSDAILLDALGKWVDGVKEDAVLVLHQIGSHGPSYYLRYPDAFRKFNPDCRSAEFADCTREEITNAYDNTILYTDHILASVIDTLDLRQDKLDTAMIYMSDHGESLGEYGLYLHGAPYMIAPSQQTHIPFILWLGRHVKQQITHGCLDAEARKPQSHDNLFHTVLGLMHVETAVHDPALDLIGACRSPASLS